MGSVTTTQYKIRPDLEPLPNRMASLPIDERGYPIPWFVDWIDGKPEFRAMDGSKFRRALRSRLCWACGLQLGVRICFVAGPMCGINRVSSEPPSHTECARWSARNCPFLSNPHMVRREDEKINATTTTENVAGVGLMRNPGVAMLWITRTYEILRTEGGTGVLLVMGEPESVEWWREGRRATLREVVDSIDSGIPALEAVARQQEGGLEALAKARKRFERWLP